MKRNLLILIVLSCCLLNLFKTVQTVSKCYSCSSCNQFQPFSDPIVECADRTQSVKKIPSFQKTFSQLSFIINYFYLKCYTLVVQAPYVNTVSKGCIDNKLCITGSIQGSSYRCCNEDACNRPNYYSGAMKQRFSYFLASLSIITIAFTLIANK